MIEHNEEQKCFRTPGGAVLSYTVKDGRYYFDHTFVPNELRGKGVAGQLAKAALKHAREQGWEVIPACSFIEAYLKQNPNQ